MSPSPPSKKELIVATSQRKKKQTKPLTEMNTAELAAVTAEFDEELVVDSFGQPTPKQKAQLRRAKRKRGRPRIGKGVQVISVSVEKGLLNETDQLAKKLNVRRAWLISRGLRAILNEEIAID